MAARPPDGPTRRSLLRGSAALLVLGGAAPLAGCTGRPPPPPGAGGLAASGPSGVTRFVYDVVMAQGLSPVEAARVFAGTLLALQRASALVDGAEPLLDRVRPAEEGEPLPAADDVDEGGLLDAVVTAVVPLLVPSLGPGSWQLVADRRAVSLAQRRAAGVPRGRLDATVVLGQAVAVDVARWVSGDGSAAAAARPYRAPTGPALWRPTPPSFAPPADPNCDLLRPIVTSAARGLPEIPPLPFSAASGSPFRTAVEEVYEVSRSLSPEQGEVAEHWSDDRGQTGTPVGHWMLLAAEGCADRGVDESTALRVLATTAVAAHDAIRECFVRKYRGNVIRPVSCVRDEIDPGWLPRLVTPPFPEHPSGHSVLSSAAAAVLTDQLGVAPLVDRVRAARVAYQGPRRFESFTAAAAEASVSRLYGGIHYRHGVETGSELGAAVGAKVVAGLLG